MESAPPSAPVPITTRRARRLRTSTLPGARGLHTWVKCGNGHDARLGTGVRPARARSAAARQEEGPAMTIPASSRRSAGQPASRLERAEPAELSDEQLAGFVMSPLARCAVTDIGPDEWFPVATVAKAARA